MKQVIQSIKRINTWTPPIPRQHVYAILVLSAFSIASVTILPHPDDLISAQSPSAYIGIPVDNANDDADSDPAVKEAHPGTEFVSISDQELLGSDKQAADGLDVADSSTPQWINYQVKSDDNLSVIFDTLNLPAKTLQQLLSVDIQNSLVRLKIDQKLSFLIDENNNLRELSIPLNGSQAVLFEQTGDSFTSKLTTIQQVASAEAEADDTYEPVIASDKTQSTPEKKVLSRLVSGQINGVFVNSAKEAGLNSKHILRIVNMFRGRIDFRRDLRKGDQFKVLFDQPYSNDAKILAVSFTIKGEEYRAFRSDDGHFYDEKASSMTSGTFMRYPTNAKFRISSQFSPNRRNPVTGRVQPHNGTDFAVPVGTPVLATGDGIVVKAATNSATGRYVVLRHNGKYSTVYMHMSKLLVRAGQKVTQGQKIGLSGNTGRSTGPHIHYEFRINNRPVNALRVDLPMNDSMSSNKKQQFLAKVNQYSKSLD